MWNIALESVAPPTGGKARARSQQKMKAKESESTHFVTFAQAAALNGPMTKLEAAQCLLGVAGTIFGPENAERVAVAIGKRMNLSEADLLPGMAKLRPRKKADGGKSDKRVALTPYTLFLCYAMKELYKQKEELPVIKDFLKQHGDGGKINFQTAIQIWRSLPCDKERLDVLKPFLDAINKDRLLRKQQLPGGASGGGAGEPAAEACERYLQYVADHPEASFVRLLKLDGSIDGLGAPGGPSAATSTKGTAAAGAGAARLLGSRGPVTTAMDVDSASADSSSDQDEEEEDEDMAEVGEDEEIVKAGVSGSGSEGAGAGQFSTPAAAMTQKDEDAEEEEGSESESTPGSGGAGSSGRESDGSGTSGGAGGGFARGEENGGRDEDGDREGEGPGGSQGPIGEEPEAGGRSSSDYASGNSGSSSSREDDGSASETEDSGSSDDSRDGDSGSGDDEEITPQVISSQVKGAAKTAAAAAPAALPKRAAAAAPSGQPKRARRGKA